MSVKRHSWPEANDRCPFIHRHYRCTWPRSITMPSSLHLHLLFLCAILNRICTTRVIRRDNYTYSQFGAAYKNPVYPNIHCKVFRSLPESKVWHLNFLYVVLQSLSFIFGKNQARLLIGDGPFFEPPPVLEHLVFFNEKKINVFHLTHVALFITMIYLIPI